MPITKHAYRCTAYLTILADPIPGENLADVDRRTNEAVTTGALACSCYVGREFADEPEVDAEVPTLVLECGCTISTNDPEPFTSFVPCSERHRLIALMIREPGSMLVVGKVKA